MRIGRIKGDRARWRWLIGETLVVVIGVLTAIGINEAWSDRQDRTLELAYLERIHAEVLRDIQVAGRSLERSELKIQLLDAVGPVARGFEPVPEDIFEFLFDVNMGAIGGVSPTYHVTRSTFEDLISTGNLRLISDANLRSDIVGYYRNYDIQFKRVVERLTGYPAFVHGLVPSELRDNLDLAAMQAFNMERAVEKVLSDEFQTLLNQEYNLGLFMRAQHNGFLESAREFLQKLAARIAYLESE